MEKWLTAEELKHDFETEKTFDEFIEKNNGILIKTTISKNPDFQNCDYKMEFDKNTILIELKSLEVDFANHENKDTTQRLNNLVNKWIVKNELSFGALWDRSLFTHEQNIEYLETKFITLKRILKKANRQIRETKKYYQDENASGMVILIDDGVDSAEIQEIFTLVSHFLIREFSQIDAFVLMTMNSYLHIPNDKYARQIWMPAYAIDAPSYLLNFVNQLGRKWSDFFGGKIGGWDTPRKEIEFLEDFPKEVRKIK